MRTGEVIKYIRESKKLKSKDVYMDILSRPTISRFEKGVSDTTTEKFFLILDNLNISLDEFYFIYNKSQTSESYNFLILYSDYFYSNNLEALKKLKLQMEQQYVLTGQVKFSHYSLITELTICRITGQKMRKEALEQIKNYLFNCEDWTYYEIVLFTNTLDFFSKETIGVLYKRTKKKLKYFSNLRIHNNEVFVLISNILVTSIENNDLESCKYFYNELIKSMDSVNNKMYEKTMIIFFGELTKLIENPNLKIDKINEIIGIFDLLYMPGKSNQCRNLYELVKKNNYL